jgi:hypothetical protein
MGRFDLGAAATNLTQLTELCVGGCDPHLLRPRFPAAALRDLLPFYGLWPHLPCKKAAWRVRWWLDADGCWVEDLFEPPLERSGQVVLPSILSEVPEQPQAHLQGGTATNLRAVISQGCVMV